MEETSPTVSESTQTSSPARAVAQRLAAAWLTPKGSAVFIAWGTAIAGITVWSLRRRAYSKNVEKKLVNHHPASHKSGTAAKHGSKSFFSRVIVDIHSEQRWRFGPTFFFSKKNKQFFC